MSDSIDPTWNDTQKKAHLDLLKWARDNAKGAETFELLNCPHCKGHLVVYTSPDVTPFAPVPNLVGPPDLL